MSKVTLRHRVAQNIAERRKSLGFTQATIAEKLHVENETISRIEHGRISLNIERLEQFAEILGCSPQDFFPPNELSQEDGKIINRVTSLLPSLKKDEKTFVLNFIENATNLFRKKNTNT